MYTLYGDGIHDDTPAIQEMLDSRVSEVFLPAPKAKYMISKTLKIYSNQTLRLGPTTTICLMDQSDCIMLENAERDSHDIAVIGGIWDYNNIHQLDNPIIRSHTGHWGEHVEEFVQYTDEYLGVIMRFCGITRFLLRGVTFKDPVTFCLQMAYITHFTVEDVCFDQNDGNPTAQNMDGVHLDGGCHFGVIRNVQGTCYDDIVALNADDFYDGPISDIQIDGVFGANSLRAVRLLSIQSQIARVSIANVFGTFYQNAIGLTYFYPRAGGRRGKMDDIVIRNVYASNAPRREVYKKPGPYTFSLIWVDSDLDVKNLVIENVFRHEEIAPIETLKICANTEVDILSVCHVDHDNLTGIPTPAITNEAHIQQLYLHDVRAHEDEVLVNRGTIDQIG